MGFNFLKFTSIIALFCILTASSQNSFADAVQSFQKMPTGIVVSFGTDALHLEVLSPGVIRVEYSVTGSFTEQRLPVILVPPTQPPFKVSQDAHSITLNAGRLSAKVDKATGTLRFLNNAGEIVTEEATGARSLMPVELPAAQPVAAYNSSDTFLLRPDEAIYGLGQHQQDYLDYRLSSVTLEQSNREVAIPFSLSSRGYGILWNNAAHTVVSLDQSDIPATALLDENGAPGGLTGHYFTGVNFDRPAKVEKDSTVDFNWDNTPPSGLPHENYSIRWNGFVKAPRSGDYVFQTAADDGVRLWVGGKLIIDDWAVHPVTVDKATVHLEASVPQPIRLEYFQATVGASVDLQWSSPSVGTLAWNSNAADDIDYVVFYGPSTDSVIQEYRAVTGEAPLIPKWALGYWQSKERYGSQQELIDVANEYRSKNEPIDNIVQDWHYWGNYPWGSHKFDPNAYPDPAAAFKTLHDNHMHVMISVWGKFNSGSPDNPDPNYDILNAHGYLLPGTIHSVWDGNNTQYYDTFNPKARELYWELMRDQIFTKGVDAWWLDASEPEVNMSALAQVNTAAGLGAFVLNGFPLMHTIGVSQGQLRDAPSKRVFILTRSAYAGQQRTGAATWSGDLTAGWDVLATQIPAGLNFCLSGIPYWTTDIGGFFVNYPGGSNNPEYRELYTRWFEYGSFCPLFRSHGTNTPREMWQFGPDTEQTLLKYDKLRYSLMPYIYSQAWNVTHNGGTMMRALVFDFPDDPTARELKDEFLFGPSILVCPVVQEGAVSRTVYLPQGAGWSDFWTGSHYTGGQTITAVAPIDKIPLFVKDGSIIPFGPEIQYVDEKPADPIDLKVYAGANGHFEFYEDEGDNNNYLTGEYATIPITWNNTNRTLLIGKRTGSFTGMLKTRTFRLVLVKDGQNGGPNALPQKMISYSGEPITVQI